MVLSHWCKLIEGLQASPLDFYKCLEEAIDRRKVPGLARSHVLHPEGGLLSAKRDYLRLSREKLLFDVCAAPFGTGFFVSCRLVVSEFPWHLLILAILIALCVLLFLWTLLITATNGLLAAFASLAVIVPPIVVLIIAVWFLQRILRGALRDLDRILLTMPAFGDWYERITRRNTYYRIDLIMSFQAAVHAAVMETVDKYTDELHLRPLSELERQPVLSPLLTR